MIPPDITRLISSEESGGKVAVFEEIVPPGGGPPRHIHPDQTEVFHIIAGTIRFEVAGQTLERGPGGTALVPPGAVHAFKNIGSTPARIHFELLPPGNSEEFFEKYVNEPPPADPAAFAQKYGVLIAGPPME